MVLPLAMGAVVEGDPTTFHTPLSGQVCPVWALVPSAEGTSCSLIGLGKMIRIRITGSKVINI